MRTNARLKWVFVLLLVLGITAPPVAAAQDKATNQDKAANQDKSDDQDNAGDQDDSDKPFTTEELDQMLAPIALYPDDLLSNVLVASTYPLEVVEAARWRKDKANAKLEGDALEKALDSKTWDPSIKSLTMTPDVLENMSQKLDWTQKLGDAFLAQEAEVMAQIQFLRMKADEAGSLKSNKQQTVTKEEKYYVIKPAKPNVVYVPVYQPTVVYGTWWYPAYPPYYWYWGRPSSAFVRGFFWGTGFAIANNLWGWGRCNWRGGNIYINVNKYNRINVNQAKITSNTWKHNAKRRGAVPYRDKATRNKYKKSARGKNARKDFRGRDNVKGRDRARPRTADSVKKQLRDGSGPKAKDRARDRKGDRKAGTKGPTKKNTKVAKRSQAKPSARKASKRKSATRKSSSRKSARGMNVKKRSSVKRHSSRGRASRSRAASRRGGGRRGGGRRGGGGRRR